MENLETLSDVIAAGNAAEDSGTPIVAHWRRVRGSLYMLEYASGGPDQVRLDDFEETFPEDFDALDPEIRHMLTGAHDYAWFRRQSRRVLAVPREGVLHRLMPEETFDGFNAASN